MVDPVTAAIIIESAKSILSGYFKLMNGMGMTDSEIAETYVNSKVEFDKNRPENLPDVDGN